MGVVTGGEARPPPGGPQPPTTQERGVPRTSTGRKKGRTQPAGLSRRFPPPSIPFQFVHPMKGKEGPSGNQAARTEPLTTEEGREPVLRPVDRGQHTTVPAWMSAGSEQPACVPGGLQQQGSLATQLTPDHSLTAAEACQAGVTTSVRRGRQTTPLIPMGVQQGGVRVPATTTMHPAAVPSPEGCEQQTTTLVWASIGTVSPTRQLGRLQQQTPGGQIPSAPHYRGSEGAVRIR